MTTTGMGDDSAELLAEFEACPFGRHSPQLQALLERMRSAPIPGKAFLYMTRPHRRWALARMSTTDPLRLEVALDRQYTSILDAERDVFRSRLAGLTGQPAEQPRYSFLPSGPSVLGYADRDSVRGGESLTFLVSSERHEQYRVELLRLRTPEVLEGGEPYRADVLACGPAGTYESVRQFTHPGSYVTIEEPIQLPSTFSVSARISPTLFRVGVQTVIELRHPDGVLWSLAVRPDGIVEWRRTDPESAEQVVASTHPVDEHRWSLVTASADGVSGRISMAVRSLSGTAWAQSTSQWSDSLLPASAGVVGGACRVTIAASTTNDPSGGPQAASLSVRGPCHSFFNGRIERPRLYSRATSATEMDELARAEPGAPATDLLADWDFSADISSERISDTVADHHGRTVNLPARAVRGSSWSGDCLDWRAVPDQYGAIHFHDDDVADAAWQPTFQLPVPASWPSGCYAVHLTTSEDGDEFFIPFFVRPPKDTVTSDVAFVVPTATYAAYANMRLRLFGQAVEMLHGRLTVVDSTDLLAVDHPELGASTYDTHRDGSLVCYSSMRRPVTNFRPKGRIYKFCQDLLITSWLEHEGVSYDVVTDEDIHREGIESLAGYRVLVTASHPEYVSDSIQDTLTDYLSEGGRLMYVGGNGYYNASEFHATLPGTVEVRRPGMEALWPIDHTEGQFSFTGRPAGPFAKIGRRSEALVGVGFITQGFDACSFYRRTPQSRDDRAAFIFEGVDDELIGDFGLLQGGAAGYEIDRFDVDRGSPPHALVLASSEDHSNVYDLMVASIVDVLPNQDPSRPEPIRADLVFFETHGGGAVFSVGSIAWSGSLGHNDFDNNVAATTWNVLTRFRSADPFVMPGQSARWSYERDETSVTGRRPMRVD